MQINCYVPITVRVVGEPTQEQLEALGQALARTVAAQLATAERVLAERVPAERHRGEAVERPSARERYGPGRDAAKDQFAQVPGYDDGGRPIAVPVVRRARPQGGAPTEPTGTHGAAPTGTHGADAGLPFEDRLLLEASRFLEIDGRRDMALLQRVVNWYADTVNDEAFRDALRRDGLDSFLRGVRERLVREQPTPSATLGADTIRMIYGVTPEEPEYWRSLSFEDRRAPIRVSDRTRAILHDRTVVIEGPGDQHDDRVIVHDNSWEMTPQALHAFLVQMVGGRLTPFEENLVANWNSLRPIPQFDGPQIVAYYLKSGGSGCREHRIHDPNGDVVAYWTTEAALVNEGLGLIDYLLMAHAALRLGGLALRAGARIVASGASSELAQNTLFALRLTTRRLGRGLGAAMEGAEAGIDVPGVGAGRTTPALVELEREPSAIAPEAHRAPPSATAPRTVPPTRTQTVAPESSAAPTAAEPVSTAPAATPRAPAAAVPRGASPRPTVRGAQAVRNAVRVVAVTAVDHTGVRRVISGDGTPDGQTDVDRADDRSWEQTFDHSPSTTTIAPGQGVVTTAPEVAAGFTPGQVTALRRILAKRFDQSDISVLQRLWDAAARAGDAAILTASNSRHLFNLQRNRFWRRVAADPSARSLFTDAGCGFSDGAPYLTVNGRRITITIDHVIERQAAPQLALTASNLRLAFSRENSVVLRLLNQLDPFQ
ncbi:hypothetical protein QMK19_31820 [Streptomyces sp. H10-C2]|uniref:hypothetical protein n=1 Tax=unclassified Streptomyces TaxID=2593676 RepID=UPI0024BB2048|nr:MULTISPECIES: hypothetical protein [unclassified Streptomyces]MDJ0345131.1 hypothetical protein [Streptomyces sp. PH10-H1]MDJ0374099.1 hypothetical protein [Streptomyces sp. H10-C2]